MRILLVCAAGMSTSLLVNNMKKFALKNDLIEAYPFHELDALIDDYDVVLVGPQIRYKMNDIEKLCREKKKAVGMIEMTTYGRVDGEAAMKQAKDLMTKEGGFI